MKKMMQKVWKNQKGFSLIELIIVIAILAIIAAIAVPNLINNINNSRRKTDVANAKQIAQAVAQVYAENPALSASNVAGDFVTVTAGPPAADSSAGIINSAIAKMQGAGLTQKMNGNPFYVVVTASTGQIIVRVGEADTTQVLFPTPTTGDYAN